MAKKKDKFIIDTTTKKISITQKNFESLTDDECSKIKLYRDFGFDLDFIQEQIKPKKKNPNKGKNEKYYREKLKDDKEGLEEFEKIMKDNSFKDKNGNFSPVKAFGEAKKAAEKRLAAQ